MWKACQKGFWQALSFIGIKYMLEKYGMLEVPFHTQARANHPSGIAAKIVADLNLATHTEVLASEVLTYIVPKLWLWCEDGMLILVDDFAILVNLCVSVLVEHTGMVLPPEICETAKVQSL